MPIWDLTSTWNVAISRLYIHLEYGYPSQVHQGYEVHLVYGFALSSVVGANQQADNIVDKVGFPCGSSQVHVPEGHCRWTFKIDVHILHYLMLISQIDVPDEHPRSTPQISTRTTGGYPTWISISQMKVNRPTVRQLRGP